jgi:hypothetical protein
MREREEDRRLKWRNEKEKIEKRRDEEQRKEKS